MKEKQCEITLKFNKQNKGTIVTGENSKNNFGFESLRYSLNSIFYKILYSTLTFSSCGTADASGLRTKTDRGEWVDKKTILTMPLSHRYVQCMLAAAATGAHWPPHTTSRVHMTDADRQTRFVYAQNTVSWLQMTIFSFRKIAHRCIVWVTQSTHSTSREVKHCAITRNFSVSEDLEIFWFKIIKLHVGNQKTLYYATSNNLCFCTTWQNAETRKSHISLNWIVLLTQCTRALSSWKKKSSSVMCLIASNICWDSKISH